MKQKCPEGYEIVREGEVVTGQATTVNRQTTGGSTVSETQTTRMQNVTEWQIVFRSKSAPRAVVPTVFTVPTAPTPPRPSPDLPGRPVPVTGP
jgi:hypothetical protein